MKILVLILSFLSCFGVQSQIDFLKLYTDSGDDFGYGIVQLEDSSYVITGASSSFSNSAQAFLLHIDSLGNYLWSNHYGGIESEEGRRVMYRPGDGFYVAGTTSSSGSGVYDFYLFKTDLNGNLLWEKTFGGFGWDRVHDATLSSDGIILVGENASNPTDNKDVFIVKTNFNGDSLWTLNYGGLGQDEAHTVLVKGDSILVAGHLYIEDSLQQKAFISLIQPSGLISWTDTIPSIGEHSIFDLSVLNNTLLAVGYIDRNDGNGKDVYHFQFDLSSLSYQNELINALTGDSYSTHSTYYNNNNGLYVCFEYEDSFSEVTGLDFALRKHNLNGTTIGGTATLSMSFPGTDFGNDVISTSDGGAIVVGNTNSIYTSYNHVFVAKIGPAEIFPNTAPPHDENQIAVLNSIINTPLINAYPNPTKDVLNIVSAPGDVIQISTLEGSVLFVSNHGEELSIKSLSSGVYLLSIIRNGVRHTQKIMKQD